MAPEATLTLDAIKERIEPVLGKMEDRMDDAKRRGRRIVVRGQHAAEDAAAEAVRKIRRRPLGAVMASACAGAMVGAVVGFAVGWLAVQGLTGARITASRR